MTAHERGSKIGTYTPLHIQGGHLRCKGATFTGSGFREAGLAVVYSHAYGRKRRSKARWGAFSRQRPCKRGRLAPEPERKMRQGNNAANGTRPFCIMAGKGHFVLHLASSAYQTYVQFFSFLKACECIRSCLCSSYFVICLHSSLLFN